MSRWESHSHCWSGVCERMNTLVVCDCDCWHETADWSCIAVSYCTLFMAALCCMAYRWLIHVALSWAALLDVCNHTVERRRAGLASREAMLLSLRAVGGGGRCPMRLWITGCSSKLPVSPCRGSKKCRHRPVRTLCVWINIDCLVAASHTRAESSDHPTQLALYATRHDLNIVSDSASKSYSVERWSWSRTNNITHSLGFF